MALPYLSPQQKDEYQKSILLFAKGAKTLSCIRSHFLPETNGVCALTGAKNQEELFVLANRSSETIKVSKLAMEIIANFVDIEDSDKWYIHIKEQRKQHKERVSEDEKRREELKKAASKAVVLRKKRPNTLLS